MDLIVTRAMAKWPNVPHCYGWLGLDARGNWRMRDERVQASGKQEKGEKIVHGALLDFINRNFAQDERGCCYFQNGPQRVYVELEAAPYIARTDPQRGLMLHTGADLPDIRQVCLSDSGQLWLSCTGKIAMLDDRDLAHCMAAFRIDGAALDDERLLAWLEDLPGAGQLTFLAGGQELAVARIMQSEAAGRFGFVAAPSPDAGNDGTK